MRPSRGSEGRSAFFGLATLILGGLLFAAGVMVGRQLALDEATKSKDPLIKIDQRDKEKKTVDGGELVFHEVLDDKKPEKSLPPKPIPKPPPESKAVPAPEAVPLHKFSLQVAAYGERSQAESLVKKLSEQGHENPRIVEKEVPGKGTFYRVRVGPFSSRQDALRVKERLEKELRVKVLFLTED